ncbi:MAG: beta-propeller fold lactonase family protein [Acidobacteriaceae bacterium]|nr:beta-propeller fold lactonase family protein [Acidobacteriaceae bacterium]
MTADRTEVLPQGWRVTPVGHQVHLLGDFPSRIILTKDGTRLLVLTSGFHHQGVAIISTDPAAVASSSNFGKAYGDMTLDKDSARLFVTAGGVVNAPTFLGTLFQQKEELSSTDFDAAILRGTVVQSRLSLQPPIRISGLAPKDQYITGVAIGHDGSLFVVNINNDEVYRLLPPTYTVGARATSGYGPYRAALSSDGSVLAVTNWGDESVTLFRAASLTPLATVRTGSHPNDLAFGPDGRLFVANAGSNSVSIIEGRQLTETIKTSIHALDPVGSTPDAVAVDPAGKRLYVANADNNDIAVVDIAHRGASEVEGFIPTGWYPSALAVSPNGKTLYVGIAKGLRSRANVPVLGAAPRRVLDPRNPFDFVADTLTGYVSIVDVPNEQTLRRWTQDVIHNFPTPNLSGDRAAHAEQVRKEVFPKIRHVLYIIRENRTYDQVLGDLGKGNGDATLTLFGKQVTPNAHRMANTWVLFDNLFVNGEVSENGHQWSDAAYATDFTSQAWLQSYSGRPEPKLPKANWALTSDCVLPPVDICGTTARVTG